ncbi:MAG: glycosyltransferase, partial [Chitinivibrionales bacterium]|nr:glycosyltransferase [Chitinivibrionales bacterium]MBD3358691.1 glycosyltransferase [Chitinivibrionales bacterium]
MNIPPKKPKVSVIIPCYNHGAFLNDAVSSVRNQTFQDYEMIIIDDGSDDPETMGLFDNNPFSDATIIRTANLGPSCARNAGIEKAQGQYILPLDADDII